MVRLMLLGTNIRCVSCGNGNLLRGFPFWGADTGGVFHQGWGLWQGDPHGLLLQLFSRWNEQPRNNRLERTSYVSLQKTWAKWLLLTIVSLFWVFIFPRKLMDNCLTQFAKWKGGTMTKTWFQHWCRPPGGAALTARNMAQNLGGLGRFATRLAQLSLKM